MKLPEAAGLLLALVARLITGAQGHWYGCPPKAEQRTADEVFAAANARERTTALTGGRLGSHVSIDATQVPAPRSAASCFCYPHQLIHVE